MSAIVRLVHYFREAQKQTVTEFVSKLYNNILTIGEWQSLPIIQLGTAEAQE